MSSHSAPRTLISLALTQSSEDEVADLKSQVRLLNRLQDLESS